MASYTLRQLKYFVTTVECGSVAEASRKLYIAQPSISTAVKGLEESFGVQLFIRHHAQGVSLTPPARLLPQGAGTAADGPRVRAERPGRQRRDRRADRHRLLRDGRPALPAGPDRRLSPGLSGVEIRDTRRRAAGTGARPHLRALRPGLPLRARPRLDHRDRAADAAATTPRAAPRRAPLRRAGASVAARPVPGTDDPARRAAQPHLFRQPCSRNSA